MKTIGIGLFGLILSGSALAGGWDQVSPKADFRFRLENKKDAFKSEGQTKQAIRARVGLKYQVDDITAINIRLATSASKPSSTNDNLGDSTPLGGANTVYFDQAYISHKAGDIDVNLGRMKFPMFRAGKTQLVFDGDFNPEGMHAGYKWNGLYINLGSFWYEENKSTKTEDGLDVTITSSQVGYEGGAGELKYNIGVSNYHYENAHATGTFGDEGMNIFETYAELSWRKFKLFYNATVNNEAEEYNTANLIGLNYGSTKLKGDWLIGANMRTIELNSLNANLMDGSFAGQTTDSSGSIVYGKYMVTDKSYLSFGYFMNTKNSDEKADPSKEAEEFTKLQLDYGVKF